MAKVARRGTIAQALRCWRWLGPPLPTEGRCQASPDLSGFDVNAAHELDELARLSLIMAAGFFDGSPTRWSGMF